MYTTAKTVCQLCAAMEHATAMRSSNSHDCLSPYGVLRFGVAWLRCRKMPWAYNVLYWRMFFDSEMRQYTWKKLLSSRSNLETTSIAPHRTFARKFAKSYAASAQWMVAWNRIIAKKSHEWLLQRLHSFLWNKFKQMLILELWKHVNAKWKRSNG